MTDAHTSSPRELRVRPLFQQGDVLRTADPDVLHSAIGGKGIHYDVRSGSALSADLRMVHRNAFCMADMTYGGALIGKVEPTGGAYRLSFGIRGCWREERGSHVLSFGPGVASLASPWEPQRLQITSSTRRLYVNIQSDQVIRRLSSLLDRPIGEAPVFSPSLDIESAAGRRIWGTVLFVAQELDNWAGEPNALLDAQLEDYLITRLLLTLAHDWSARLSEVGPAPSPATLRRAIDFIDAHADEPLTVMQLAAVAGISVRTLLRHFQAYRGMSPLQFIRQTRLRRVHNELRAARPGDTVTTILHRWGFGHAGRFALEYRKRYGEKPSATLVQGRRR